MEQKFNPKDYEKKWKEMWDKEEVYKTSDDVTPENKYYCLDMYPYPSGSGLHVGHPKGYLGSDVVARFMRMQGKNVLHPMGFDSFGLPAENYAIKSGIHPQETTDKAIEMFKSQIENIGLSYDWSKELSSHNPDFMKWTQWIFLQMYKKGVAYKKKAPVNWCPQDQTVLANEQIEADGTCERCGSVVIQKEMEQWFFKITDYAERLINDLQKIDWPESTKLGQINWIGKSTGINIEYPIDGSDKVIAVFTTRPDTNFGATFLVLAPDSPFVKENVEIFPEQEAVQKYIEETKKKTELDRLSESKKKTGVFTGLYAINRLNDKKLPIYLSDFVLGTVGTGAVVGVPGHDIRDFDFAKAMGIEILRVVVGPDGDESEITESKQVQEDAGKMINSEFLDGMEIMEAKEKIMDYIEEQGWGKRVINYRLRDWLVSRQRYWGCPIPIVYDPEGNPHPVDESELPVLLPTDVDFKPTGESPLKYSESFHKSAEEKYGKGWKREVDTMDTFVDSSWYFLRYPDVNNDKEFASKEKLNAWMPVDLYVGGAEHTVLHLMYARFFTKFLADEGYLNYDEPFQKLRHQGMIAGPDGRKMSKRWGNIINPDDEIEKYGADTLRIYEMFMGPFKEGLPWSTETEVGVFRFIVKIWNLKDKVDEQFKSIDQERWINKVIKKVEEDINNMSFNTAVAKMMEFINFLGKEEKIQKDVWEKFLLVLAPFGPFITEELWSKLGNEFSIHKQNWPKYDPAMIIDDTVNIAIQINGKVRDTIEVEMGSEQDSVLEKAMQSEKIKKYVEGEPKKVIFVKNRIINIIV